MRVKNTSEQTVVIFQNSDPAEKETSLEPGETAYAHEDQEVLVSNGDGMPVGWALHRGMLEEAPMRFYELVEEAAELDYVREVAVTNDGSIRGMEIRITGGPALSASQALEEPTQTPYGMTLAHGGQESEGTYEILAIDEEDNQTKGSSVTPEGRAVKGGLPPEEVLQSVEDMYKEAKQPLTL